MMTPEEFVELFGKEKQSKNVRFGKITDVTGKPRVLLDGEVTASTKRYPRLASYTPVVSHRVMIVNGVIIGNII